ncbi:MAG: restriction endonuclease subunit S, partial [Weissella confusa]
TAFDLNQYATATAQPGLAVGKISEVLSPIPPVTEQLRINSALEKLSAHITQYGALEDEREQLDTELPEHLRKSILQMAVQGKLIPQDPADEPASELLERIRAERAELIKQKKLKAPKGGESVIYRGSDGGYYEKRGSGEPVCIDDEIPFEIPKSWEWCRLGDLGDWGAGATPAKGESKYYTNGTIPWLLTGDLTDGPVSTIPNYITEEALKKTSVRLNPVGSVLIAMYGATIGKIGILEVEATTNQACCACILHVDELRPYLFYFLLSQQQEFRKKGEGGAQPNISKQKIVATLMPVPPLVEQERIVAALNSALSSL